MIVLTSFGDIPNFLDYKVYSISDKQPSDLNLGAVKYDRLDVFVPGPNLLNLSNEDFVIAYEKELEDKREEIKKVVRDLLFSSVDSGVLLCCWCSKDFHKEKKTFCHRIIIKDFIKKYLSYVKTEMRGL